LPTTRVFENVTDSAKSANDISLETSIPNGGASLESVLCTEELRRRPCRKPDREKENRALVALASALAGDSTHAILQTLAETILQVTESDSSGISLLTTDDGGKRFYWPAIAGEWKPHIGGGTRRDFAPSGDVLERNCALLFKHPERHYKYLLPVMPAAEECLLVPFYVGGKAVGTMWAIMHSDRREFDAEDERLMNVLGQFASLAYQTLASIENLKLQMTAREKAKTELWELTNGLETQVRIRTEELEHRNKELAEARAQLADEKLYREQSETYLVEAQRLSHTGSWYWNARTGEVVWSKEFFAIFGFDPPKTKPSYLLYLERIHPEDRCKVEEVRWAAVREKRDFDAEYRLLLPGGLIKYLHSIGHCLVNQSGDIEYIGALMDITEHKRAEEEHERLRQAQADLAHINRVSMLGELTAALAHEIKQPISAAKTNARTCMRWLARDQPDLAEAQEAASRVIKDVTRASDIISRIGSLFKKDVPQREWLDVNELIREMIVLLRTEATRYSIWIQGDLADDLPEIMADRVQLQQVLMNLMLNGMEAMKGMRTPGKLTIRSQRDEKSQLLVSVADTGVGLQPGEAERIFKPFFTSKSQGIGMGLPISRSIIESHGGNLWATSNAGPGATFHFNLPIQLTAEQAA
jgi:signal transduction histidine kinase/GAF domain-containing protein